MNDITMLSSCVITGLLILHEQMTDVISSFVLSGLSYYRQLANVDSHKVPRSL